MVIIRFLTRLVSTFSLYLFVFSLYTMEAITMLFLFLFLKEVMNLSQSIPSSRQVHTLSLSSGIRHHDSNKMDSMRPAEAEKALGSAAAPLGAAAAENNKMLMVKCLAAPPPPPPPITTHSGSGFDGAVKIAPPQGFENIGSRFAPPQGFDSLSIPSQGKDSKDLPTPSSTPTTSR